MPSIAGAGLGVPTSALHGSGFHPGYVHCRSHPCSLFLPIRSAFTPLRALHCQKIKFSLKQKKAPVQKTDAFYSGGRTRGSNLRPPWLRFPPRLRSLPLASMLAFPPYSVGVRSASSPALSKI